jgi:hypothetical protein
MLLTHCLLPALSRERPMRRFSLRGIHDYSPNAWVCVNSHLRISLVSGALSIFISKHVSLLASKITLELDQYLDGKA